MEKSKLHTLTLEQLTAELSALLKEQFNLRMQQANRALSKTHLARKVRRDIARVKTLQTKALKEQVTGND